MDDFAQAMAGILGRFWERGDRKAVTLYMASGRYYRGEVTGIDGPVVTLLDTLGMDETGRQRQIVLDLRRVEAVETVWGGVTACRPRCRQGGVKRCLRSWVRGS